MRSMEPGFAAPTALLALLLAAPAAHATYDPLGSGQTKLTLDKGFASFLKRDGVTLSAKAGAKRKGSSFLLPVVEGNFDPTLGKGEIDTEGTLVFQNQRKRVPLRKVVVKTKHTP